MFSARGCPYCSANPNALFFKDFSKRLYRRRTADPYELWARNPRTQISYGQTERTQRVTHYVQCEKRCKVIVSSRRCDKMEEDENSSLIQGHVANNDTELDDDNPDLSRQNTRKCKVYKRRWYILFVFTLTSIVSNFMWNTWGPIQRPCRTVFGWEIWTVLLLSSFGAIGPILGFIPSTWLMDTKGKPNSPFPSCRKPLYQSEAWCTTIHMKMSLIYM